MPNRKALYKNKDKFRETFREQKARYRKRTGSGEYAPSTYTDEQNQMILAHEIPDRELSEIIKHSVDSIQRQRCKLKKRIAGGQNG